MENEINETESNGPLVQPEPFRVAEPQKFEYEFSFMWEGKPHFCTLWDTDDVSAAERVLCHPVKREDIQVSPTGNHFVVDKDGTHWVFKKEPYNKSFVLPELKPDLSELTPTRRTKQPQTADDILASLV